MCSVVAGRPKKSSGALAPLESEVMEAVWRAGTPVRVRVVLDALNAARTKPLAYTTVMTVMTRLAAKGVLVRRGERRSYVYEPTAKDAAGLAVKDVMRTYGDAAVAHFMEQARADPAIARRLRALLAEER
ncbi:MAG TPA: BlaI/MecI/CopY family transcriptional regulator [Solirubrobacteraceae bacterium]|jgi:predicted transcriptional regulator|nr:BlaI/MecI/CopY family transcriptional regulator [Solirubrobacteraceae bacterium]